MEHAAANPERAASRSSTSTTTWEERWAEPAPPVPPGVWMQEEEEELRLCRSSPRISRNHPEVEAQPLCFHGNHPPTPTQRVCQLVRRLLQTGHL